MLHVSVFSLYEKLFYKPLPAHLRSAEVYNSFLVVYRGIRRIL